MANKSAKLKALIMGTMPMDKSMPMASKTPMAPTKKAVTKKKKKLTQAMKSTGSIMANINKKGK